MDRLKLVVFVGMPGSGKSSCVDYLVKKGFPSVYFGGVALDELKLRSMTINEANEKHVREELRATEGKGVFAKRIIKQIEDLESQGQKRIVVDGLYTWTEYKIFKDRFDQDMTVIALTAAKEERHNRLASRMVRPLTESVANERDYAEIENLEKGGPIANADYTIVNDTGYEDLFKELDRILEKIGFNG